MDASLCLAWSGWGWQPHPVVPLLAKGEGRLHQQTGQGSAVIPNASEESSGWMLHFVQHDRVGHCAHFLARAEHAVLCHSEHSEESKCG